MGAVSLHEDIQRRRDEALSQLNKAFEAERVSPGELVRFERELERIVSQAFRSINDVFDVITDPDFDAAKDVLETQKRNIKLSGELHSARTEIARLQGELALAADHAKKLEREKRDLAHELNDHQQRLRAEKRRRR